MFTTVGSQLKTDFLCERFPGLVRDHILYSRDTKFEQDIMRMTGSKGVNVVLNSLAGEQLKVKENMCNCRAVTDQLLVVRKTSREW